MQPHEYLEKLLVEHDVANKDLAELAGVHASTVQRWMSGACEPPLMLLRLLECMTLLKRMDEERRRAVNFTWADVAKVPAP